MLGYGNGISVRGSGVPGWINVRDEDWGRFCCSIWFCWKERGLYGMKALERASRSALLSLDLEF